MDRMRMESVNLTQRNIEKIAAMFPSVMTEKRGADGEIHRAINFEALRQLLTEEAIAGDEVYEFTWVGKKAAMVEASRPIRKTLRPCVEESKDWDTTENLYIEGDNLDVLKLLQESYLGRVKMIYIDPPYNTGHDFIYRDSFARSQSDENEQMGMFDEDTEERLFENTESNGRFHSDWCSMMYSRLMVARNLLSDDGAVFISIDDNEINNLIQICNEVFGESNFYANIVWQKRTSPDARFNLGAAHDYICVYAKNWEMLRNTLHKEPLSEDRSSQYKNPDNDPRGVWASVDITGQTGHATASQYYEIMTPAGIKMKPPLGRCWALSQNTFQALVQDGRIWFGEDGTSRPRQKKFLSESEGGNAWTWWTNTEVGHNQEGAKDVKVLLGSADIFSNPKPVKLLERMLKLATDSKSIVMDFFSGSATTAHAVMQLNAEDGGHRKFIMVQLPEACDSKSEAYKAGYRTICDIGKERIRRAGEKIKAEAGMLAQGLDVGFRVLRVDESNMKDVYYGAAEYSQMMLDDLVSNIRDDRTPLDLLFGCLLEWGLPLSLPYHSEQIDGFTVHTYNDGDLIACFDADISEKAIREIARRKPLRVVFRDSSFATSPERINVEEIFKLLAPNTSVKVL